MNMFRTWMVAFAALNAAAGPSLSAVDEGPEVADSRLQLSTEWAQLPPGFDGQRAVGEKIVARSKVALERHGLGEEPPYLCSMFYWQSQMLYRELHTKPITFQEVRFSQPVAPMTRATADTPYSRLYDSINAPSTNRLYFTLRQAEAKMVFGEVTGPVRRSEPVVDAYLADKKAN